ncbi:endonuclease/exonuclease/phosphatase family protein [Candidatus Sumerlaeota bacterium]|nr:endonuclease/exonuclease/phosphatase family protein [Candidatus Sumerlaeota bacterium]
MTQKRLLSLFAALASLFATNVFAQEQPTAAAEPAPIKLMAWNLEHFVDPFDDPYIAAQKEDDPDPKSDSVLRLLTEAMRRVDPDVLVTSEVESDRALKLFLDSYLPGNKYQYYACLPAKEWYQNVVVASKFPIGEIISFREAEIYNEMSKQTRNDVNSRLMAVDIKLGEGYQFTLYATHLKAGAEPEDYIWRERQTDLLKADIDQRMKENPNTNIIVMGDLNYTPKDKEYPYFMESGATKLVDAFAKQGYPATHPSTGPRRDIDHIFLNEGMMKEVVPDSATVALPLCMDEMATITDHLPVVISITPHDK